VPVADVGSVLDAFGLRERHYVHLIGAGGKTTLMFAAAHALAGEGRSVLTTTTTRILLPGPAESACVVVGADAAPLVERLGGELAAHRHVTVVAPDLDGGRKAGGLPVAVLDALVEARVAGHVLVEADGSAGRPLKAHAEHEPVVSARADLVIAVIGLGCLGAPMDDEHVHRAALLRERLGRPAGAVVRAEDVAGIVLHREGWLARLAPGCEVIAFVNQAVTPAARDAAGRIAAALRAADAERRVARIVVGDARSGRYEVAG
jgi:probable selenium-dependent hydroxylase accessory protein YqeC